jgi:hypothetical protein
MPTTRDFGYSTGAAPSGSTKYGNVIVNRPTNGFAGTGIPWIGGPDEDLGYCIAKSNVNPIWTSPSGVNSRVGFGRSLLKSEQSFLDLVNNDYGQNFQVGSQASTYLTNNGVWNSYGRDGYSSTNLILSLDATNPNSAGDMGYSSWYDLSGNGNDGSIVNGAYWSGIFGGDFYFDGSDDRIVTPIGDIGPDATYEAVICSFGNATTYNMFIGQYLPYIGAYDGNSVVYSDYINGGQTWFKTDPGTITTNQYHHVICTRSYDPTSNTTRMEIYIDGVLQNATTVVGQRTNFASPENITIGDGAAFNWYTFYGRIAMVRVYNKALPSNEIDQNYLYSRRKMFTTTSLSLYIDASLNSSYPNSGNTVNDLSGNSLNFTNAFVRKGKFGINTIWSNGNDVDSPTTSILNNDQHSIEMILMFKSSPSYPNGWTGSWEQFFGYYSGGSDRSPGVWRYPSERRIHWRYSPNNSGNDFGKNSSYEEFDLNTYYHIVVTKNGGDCKAYVNGDLAAANSVSNPKDSGNSIIRFYDYYTSDLMEIQMCRIYTRPLTETEVQINRDSLKNRIG